MIVTSSRPVKERSVASHSKYILLQPSPVGEAQGPAWHSPRKWTFGVILIWRATGTMVSKERGKENKAGREGKTGRNWSCSVPPSHVLAPPHVRNPIPPWELRYWLPQKDLLNFCGWHSFLLSLYPSAFCSLLSCLSHSGSGSESGQLVCLSQPTDVPFLKILSEAFFFWIPAAPVAVWLTRKRNIDQSQLFQGCSKCVLY